MRQPLIVLFCDRGIRGCHDLTAVVAQSTRALRGRLAAAGVPYSTPLVEALPAGAGAQPQAAEGDDQHTDEKVGRGGGGGGKTAGRGGIKHMPEASHRSPGRPGVRGLHLRRTTPAGPL